jgi:hypothetical protein
MKDYQPQSFVYKWTHLPTGMWYIGSRTAKNCHPDDGYICSSISVKSMILSDNSNWSREILGTGTPDKMRNLEALLLAELNAANDSMSYNKHNNDGKFNFRGGTPQSISHRKKISIALTGIQRSEEYREKQSRAKKGIPRPNQSLATKGVPKPNVSKAKKGVPQKKVLCRLMDRKEMCLAHFNRWCNRQDNPEILQAIFAKTKGVPKKKEVCRLIDQREMCLGHFNRWTAMN